MADGRAVVERVVGQQPQADHGTNAMRIAP
jgi:hypothetical protein